MSKQIKMKDLLKEEYDEKAFSPVKIPNFDKYLDKYGLGDLLYTALEFYKINGEKASAATTLKCIQVYKRDFKAE